MKTAMVALLAPGLITYAFHVNVFLMMLAIYFAVSAVTSLKPLYNRRGFIIPIMLFIFSAYTAITIFQKWRAAENCNAPRKRHAIAATALLLELNKILRIECKLLAKNGWWQLASGHLTATIVTLEKVRQYFVRLNAMEVKITAMGKPPTTLRLLKPSSGYVIICSTDLY